MGKKIKNTFANLKQYTKQILTAVMVVWVAGAVIGIVYEFVRLAVAPDTDFCNRNMPEDPAEWGKIVEALLNHWVERYGKEEVETWRFECWNEPAATDFFKGTRQEFVSLHQAFLQSIKHVEDKQGVKLLAGTQSGITLSNFFPAIFDAARQAGNIDET